MEDIKNIHSKLTNYFNELIKDGTIYDVTSLEYNYSASSPSRASEKETFTVKKFDDLKVKISFYIHLEEGSFFGERFSSNAYETAEFALEDIKIRINAMIEMKKALAGIKKTAKRKKQSDKDILKEELRVCLENENYERASEIEKEIEELDAKNKKKKTD